MMYASTRTWEGLVIVRISGSGVYEWAREAGLLGPLGHPSGLWSAPEFGNLRIGQVTMDGRCGADIEFTVWSNEPVYNTMQAILLATRSLVHLPRQDLLRTMRASVYAEPKDPDAWWRDL